MRSWFMLGLTHEANLWLSGAVLALLFALFFVSTKLHWPEWLVSLLLNSGIYGLFSASMVAIKTHGSVLLASVFAGIIVAVLLWIMTVHRVTLRGFDRGSGPLMRKQAK
jgi:hypothetical protein